MRWTNKARLQNIIDRLPSKAAHWVYYHIQRQLGGLRNSNPISRLKAARQIATYIRGEERRVEEGSFIDIGTGRRLNVAFGLWLCGAEHVLTVDLNPYLSDRLVSQDRAYIHANRAAVRAVFDDFSESPLFDERLNILADNSVSNASLLERANVKYMAPADASQLNVSAHSFDYHVSYTVLEHIPKEILRAIFTEGKRILRNNGLFVHLVDLTDHFSHSDTSISKINFLRFSESEWLSIVNNRFMYQNRLRKCQFDELFDDLELQVKVVSKRIDDTILSLLDQGFPVSDQFSHFDLEELAITSAHYVLRR